MNERSVSLIDAQFLENARRSVMPDSAWSLPAFVQHLVPRYHWRFRTYYFDALPYKARNQPTDSQIEKYNAKEKALDAIERLERFTVRRGYCKRSRVMGFAEDRESTDENPVERRHVYVEGQKMVDVLLATELTRIAWSQEARHISLVAGDADFAPAVEAAKAAGAVVRLFVMDEHRSRTADKLLRVADERFNLRTALEAVRDGVEPDARWTKPITEPKVATIQKTETEENSSTKSRSGTKTPSKPDKPKVAEPFK